MASVAGVETLGLTGAEQAFLAQNPDVLRKVSDFALTAEENKNALAKAKADLEMEKMNAEQQFAQLEKRVFASEAMVATKNAALARMEETQRTTDKALEERRARTHAIETQLQEATAQVARQHAIIEALKEDVRVLQEAKTRKDAEIDQALDENKSLFTQVVDLRSQLAGKSTEAEDMKGQVTTWHMKEQRLEQLHKMLQEQIDTLGRDLAKKTEECNILSREKAQAVFDLQRKLDDRTDEARAAAATTDDLRAQIEKLTKRADDLRAKLEKVESEAQLAQGTFQQELSNKSKLCDLYKSSCEEAQAKVKQVTAALAELQRVFKQANDDAAAAEVRQREELDTVRQALAAKDNDIKALQLELDNANALLAQGGSGGAGVPTDPMQLVSPTAAAASAVLKEGLTLTQMWTQLLETRKQLHGERSEVQRLEAYLQQILKDIQDKAPIFQQQRNDLVKAGRTNAQLTQALEEVNKELARLDDAHVAAGRQVAIKERENALLKKDLEDISRQVQLLLRENENLRLGEAPSAAAGSSLSPRRAAAPGATSGDVIGANLVDIRSISELQQQNVQLRNALRDLAAQRETEEQARQSEETARLQEQLDAALKELEEMGTARDRQIQMVKAIVHQRDMFRTLYSEACVAAGRDPSAAETLVMASPSRTGSNIGSIIGSSTPATAASAAAATSAAAGVVGGGMGGDESAALLKELQTSFENYRKERAESDKMAREELDTAKADAQKVRMENIKLTTQLDGLNERYQDLKRSLDASTADAQRYRTKNTELGDIVVKLQQRLDDSERRAAEAAEALVRAQFNLENAKAEKELLQAAERRLAQENESLLTERRSQNTLLLNLQNIQNEMKRGEHETKTRLNTQIDMYQQELKALRARMATEQQQAQAKAALLEQQLAELREEVSKAKDAHQKTREELLAVTYKSEALAKELATTQGLLDNSEKRINLLLSDKDKNPSAATDAAGAEKERLGAALREVQNLQEQLKIVQESEAQLKAISAASEEALRDLNENTDLFKRNVAAKEEQARKELATLREALEEIEAKRVEAEAKVGDLVTELANVKEEMAFKLAAAERRVADAVASEAAALKREQLAQEDCKIQASLAAENADNYQRQVVLHAADVQDLTTVRSQTKTLKEELQAAQAALAAARDELASASASWAEQKRILQEDAEKQTARREDLEKQNVLLHTHLEEVSSQVLALRRQQLPGTSADLFQQQQEQQQAAAGEEGAVAGAAVLSANASPSKAGGKSTEELWEVLRYQRTQAQIAQTEAEQARLETQRLQQALDHANRQLSETRALLEQERERTQLQVQTSVQQTQLMAKVEKLNLLEDSNRLLRDEKERLEGELKSVQARARSLENSLGPLQDEVRTLSKKLLDCGAELVSEQNAARRWKARAQTLTETYETLDVQEYHKLKEQQDAWVAKEAEMTQAVAAAEAKVKTLETKLAEANATLAANASKPSGASLQELETTKASLTKSEEMVTRLKTLCKTQRDTNASITKELEELKASAAGTSTEAATETEKLRAEVAKLRAEAETLRADLAEAKTGNDARQVKIEKAIAKIKRLNEDVANEKARREALQKELAGFSGSNAPLTSVPSDASVTSVTPVVTPVVAAAPARARTAGAGTG